MKSLSTLVQTGEPLYFVKFSAIVFGLFAAVFAVILIIFAPALAIAFKL